MLGIGITSSLRAQDRGRRGAGAELVPVVSVLLVAAAIVLGILFMVNKT